MVRTGAARQARLGMVWRGKSWRGMAGAVWRGEAVRGGASRGKARKNPAEWQQHPAGQAKTKTIKNGPYLDFIRLGRKNQGGN